MSQNDHLAWKPQIGCGGVSVAGGCSTSWQPVQCVCVCVCALGVKMSWFQNV